MRTIRYRGWRLIAERDRLVIERDNARRGPMFAIGPHAHLAGSIRAARLSGGLTQQQFAARIGCSMKSVQNWEAGATTPRFGSVRAIASATGRPLESFYKSSAVAPPEHTAADAGGAWEGREAAPGKPSITNAEEATDVR